MRGALTDGSVWIFLILNMNPNGVGALYNYTLRVDPEFLCKGCPDEDGDDMIAGILASWVSPGHSKFSCCNINSFHLDSTKL
jgi:hypothetical protein